MSRYFVLLESNMYGIYGFTTGKVYEINDGLIITEAGWSWNESQLVTLHDMFKSVVIEI